MEEGVCGDDGDNLGLFIGYSDAALQSRLYSSSMFQTRGLLVPQEIALEV